ncbi:uncharacterized protein LOC143855713 isoform X1 [Tasmannia lanceolata]|uniref:uncharacterized protein LOC143855713 isoform X1 n=1 Tax=Tasmannia lanceolata TaxID=3420 RepID=UPI0040645131
MAIIKFLIFSIFFSLIFLKIEADASIEEIISASEPLKIELGQLKSKISVLESSIDDRTRELKSKDQSIAQMKNDIKEKSDSILALQHELESLQKKGSVDAEEQVGKAHARASELENQVEKLKTEIEAQNRKSYALEARASEAERKVRELNLRLESLQKINDEQKKQIRKTERALKVAEEEIMKAKLETTSKHKELLEVHGAWLPPWLSTHLILCQSFAERNWNEFGKPALDVAIQQASEKSAQAQKWAEPHVETVKTRWIPALKEQWVAFITFVRPYMQSATTRTIEFYNASKSTLMPHILKVQELTTPYFQEAKKVSNPYIDQVATFTKPHVHKVRVVLKPYSDKVVYTSGKFLKSATVYHHQVQATVQEQLKKHELTKPLATKELVWFTASALLALPIFFLYKLCSDIFCKTARKPTRSANTIPAPRRPKRRHAEK